MNGRVYDPYLGRFLSPDTVVQSLTATQSINPYAYAWNDPLKYVDPNGHSLLGDIIGAIVGVVVAIYAPELIGYYESTLYGATLTAGSMAVLTGAVAGFVGGFVGAMISTGSVSAALTAGLIGGVAGGLTAGIGQQVLAGNWTTGEGVIARSAVGCLAGAATSGNCGKGALSAAFAMAAQPMIIKFLVWHVGCGSGVGGGRLVGGEAAKIAGGKFDDGFSTAAVQYLATFRPSSEQQTGSPGLQFVRGRGYGGGCLCCDRWSTGSGVRILPGHRPVWQRSLRWRLRQSRPRFMEHGL